jgi:hypothetical protein
MIMFRNQISFATVRVSVDDLVVRLGAGHSHASVADRVRSDFVSGWHFNIFLNLLFGFLHALEIGWMWQTTLISLDKKLTW